MALHPAIPIRPPAAGFPLGLLQPFSLASQFRLSFSQWLRLLRAGGLITPATWPLEASTKRGFLPMMSFDR
jgi:hypothetical protein